MGDVFQTCRHAEIAHHDLARPRLQITARRIARGMAGRGLDFFKRDAEGCETIGIGLHLDLFHASTDGEHLRHTADALQAPFDRPIRQRAQIHRQNLAIMTAQADEQDLTHERRHRRHARFNARRQRHGLHALLHELSCPVDVRAPAELGEHQRQADIGVRTQPVQPADTLHGAFNRLSDQGFDFFWRQAGCFRQDGDGRLRHVR